MKEPEQRVSLHEVMQHPWVTNNGASPLPTVAASGLQVPFCPLYALWTPMDWGAPMCKQPA